MNKSDQDNQTPKVPNRRRLVKALTLTGPLAVAQAVPSKWADPVVRTVATPAHAATTCEIIACTSGFYNLSGGEFLGLIVGFTVRNPGGEANGPPECVLEIDGQVVATASPGVPPEGVDLEEGEYYCEVEYSGPRITGDVVVRADTAGGSCSADLGSIPDASDATGPLCGTADLGDLEEAARARGVDLNELQSIDPAELQNVDIRSLL